MSLGNVFHGPALRIPGTGLAQAIEMQKDLEAAVAELPEVDRVFSKIGTGEMANDPMPPSVADTFIMMKPHVDWPDPDKPRDVLIDDLTTVAEGVPGNNSEVTQPIELRFNELIAGVRAELAVKIYGDDLDMLAGLAEAVEAVVAGIPGAADVRTEQVTGLPIITDTPDRNAWRCTGLRWPKSRTRFRLRLAAELPARCSKVIAASISCYGCPHPCAAISTKSVASRYRCHRPSAKLPAGYWIDYSGTFEPGQTVFVHPLGRGYIQDMPHHAERVVDGRRFPALSAPVLDERLPGPHVHLQNVEVVYERTQLPRVQFIVAVPAMGIATMNRNRRDSG